MIAFVDSDDWLELDMFEVLYTNLKEKNVDIACVGYYQCYICLLYTSDAADE